MTKRDCVKPSDIRPARPDGKCFYCYQPLGSKHKKDCVILERTVTVAFTVTIPWRTVRSWSDGETESHLNDSGWCASNLIQYLEAYEKKHGCLCSVTEAKVIPKKKP